MGMSQDNIGGGPYAGSALADTAGDRPLERSEVVYRGRIWDVVQDKFRLGPAGDALVRDYIEHPGAVAVLALDEAGRVLLINQYRHPVKMNLWEIPAGLLDVDGEDPQAAAVRELAEEADLRAEQWDVLVDIFNSPGSSSEAIRIYLVRGLSEVPGPDRHVRTEEEAEIQFRWVPLTEAAAAVLAGHIHNPSAVGGVLAAVTAQADGFSLLRPADAPWIRPGTGATGAAE